MSKLLAGYPLTGALGTRNLSSRNHVGPASYTQVVTGATPTGGDSASMTPFGFSKGIDSMFAAISDDGQYLVVPIFPVAPANPANGSVTKVTLIWIIAHTGAEVTATTDLSGRTVRLTAVGL